MKKLLGSKPAPLRNAVVDTSRVMAKAWAEWFEALFPTLGSIPGIVSTVNLAEQGAAIVATDFSGGRAITGVYRISFGVRITQAATTSSSLTVTFSWTDGGVVQSWSGAAVTGNTTTTTQSKVFLIRSDADAAITYSTAYASVGATSMEYSLDASLEQVKI